MSFKLTEKKNVRCDMAGNTDIAKGRLKKAAGELTGNKRLKQEGAVDEAAGNLKQKTGKLVDSAKKALKGKKNY